MQTVSGTSYNEHMQDLNGQFASLEMDFRGLLVPDEKGQNSLVVWNGDTIDLLFDCHPDTVAVKEGEEWIHPPFEGFEESDYSVHGRGAMDVKAYIAGILHVLEKIAAKGDEVKNIGFAFPVEEESTMSGIDAVLTFLSTATCPVPKPQKVIVCEPTGGTDGLESGYIVYAHKGQYFIKVTYHGEAGHSGFPSRAINAIDIRDDVKFEVIRPLAQSLTRYTHPAFAQTGDPDYMHPTLVSTMLDSGEAPNIVPGTCTEILNLRFLPTEDGDPDAMGPEILQQIRDGLDQYGLEGKYELELLKHIPAFCVPELTPIVQDLQRLFTVAKPTVVAYGTHAAKWQQYGHRNVCVFGYGDMNRQNGHKANEYVTAEILDTTVKQTERIIRRFCVD